MNLGIILNLADRTVTIMTKSCRSPASTATIIRFNGKTRPLSLVMNPITITAQLTE
ncbi:hypothetical protein ACVWWK_001578 [Bradyrhizobium sp. LB9.1b]